MPENFRKMRRIIDDFFPKDITTILNQPEKLLLDNGRFFLGLILC